MILFSDGNVVKRLLHSTQNNIWLHCSLMANSAIYLIFTVSSLTLHLRFCCNNTGKRNLRTKSVLSNDMTRTHAKKCLPVLLTCLNAFMLGRKEMSRIFTYERPLRMIWFHLWTAWWLLTCFMKFDSWNMTLPPKSCTSGNVIVVCA